MRILGKRCLVNEGCDGMRLVFLSLALLFLAAADMKAQLARDDAFHARYHLDKVVMVGRHHVRSGVISKTERRITPHQWHQWTVGDGNLTERGAMLEQQMGVFYRLWTMQEGLYGEASAPVVGQTRLYANSMPRTVETARSFAAGFSPDHAMEADYDKSVKFGSMSPVFNDVSTKVTPKILAKANAEVEDGCAPDGFAAAVARLEEDAAVMARVLDLQNSPACQLHDTCSFLFTNPQVFLRQKIMPRITAGLIYLAQMASGNLVLQYYDMPESRGSIFGHPVTLSDLCSIGRVKDSWCFLSMGFPTIGRDVAHNLLIRLKNEMEDSTVRLSYLVGHDSNMAALAGALELEKYVLENTPEEKTPLGGKMTFEVWKDADDNAFVALNYVYQNVDQIMEMTPLSLEVPPMVHPLCLKQLKPNADGLYPLSDFMAFLGQAIAEYDDLDSYRQGDVNLDRRVDMLDVVDVVNHLLGNTWRTFVQEVADDNGDGSIDLEDASAIMQLVARGQSSLPE